MTIETPSSAPATPASAIEMRRDRIDMVSLVGGIAVALIGTLLLLDVVDAVNLRFGALAPLACAAVGGVLLARGLEGGAGESSDR
jgi:hypothetical protein